MLGPIDRQHFFNGVRPLFHTLEESQVQGMTVILDGWEKWAPENSDLNPNERWLAYELATSFWETGQKMAPVREIGLGHGKSYGTTYYGRGLVQLTWDYNYKAMGQRLGVDLFDHPDLALDPAIAAKIMFEGMAHGYFTGARLGQFFGSNPAKDDPVNARRIINGSDHNTIIAGYHKNFLAALTPSKV